MRVLHYCNSFSNLSEAFIYDCVTELDKQEVKCHVLAFIEKQAESSFLTSLCPQYTTKVRTDLKK